MLDGAAVFEEDGVIPPRLPESAIFSFVLSGLPPMADLRLRELDGASASCQQHILPISRAAQSHALQSLPMRLDAISSPT